MGRKSSMDTGTPDDSAGAAKRAAEFLGYEPTPGQRLVKSQFWAAWREDPSVEAAQLTSADVARMVDAPSIDRWWRESGFRDWFLNREEWRGRADAALHMTLDLLIRRVSTGMMSDKDLISAMKLLVEVGGKIPRVGAAKDEKPVRELTEAEARKMIEDQARGLGWAPPTVQLLGTSR